MSFFGIWEQEKVYLFMLVSIFFLSDDVLDLDVWDCKTKHLAREVLQKSNFREVAILMIL